MRRASAIAVAIVCALAHSESSVPIDGSCVNKLSRTVCNRWKEYCAASYAKWQVGQDMKNMCCQTCGGFKDNDETTVAPPAASATDNDETTVAPPASSENGGCENTKSWCDWRKDLCTGKQRSWMMENCCKTCSESSRKSADHVETPDSPSVTTANDPCVDDMNKYRRMHEGTGDLQYDQKLTEDAQKWADKLAKEKKFYHANNKETGQGENLYKTMSWCSNCAKAKKSRKSTCPGANLAWYGEIKDWSENTFSGKGVVGHFTQMVWKATTKVGFGIAEYEGADGWRTTLVVARFLPPGNYQPQGLNGPYSQNVGRLKKEFYKIVKEKYHIKDGFLE